MNVIVLTLIILFAGAALSYFAKKINPQMSSIVSFVAILLASVLFLTSGKPDAVNFTLGGFNLEWALNDFGYIFAVLVLVLATLISLYSISYMKGMPHLGYFNSNFMLAVASMMGIVLSNDFISLFIFWEIMTWSSYLLVIYKGRQETSKIGIKYMIFSAIGAYAMLTAIVLINARVGTTNISEAINLGALGSENILIPILLLIGFSVKAATMPLHVWAPGAYSESPMSFTALFSGALSKMGVFGIAIVFSALMLDLEFAISAMILQKILMWLGGITAVVATLYALIQQDAKKLLAYSSVAQLGYITIGLASGTKLGVMAGLFMAVMHGAIKAVLFMAVGAVEKAVGTTDMTQISGLIKKMPVTFFATLVAIIALAGVPPVGGFVGKWMLYETLITSDSYFLVIVIFFSSTAAFLYSYRIIFGLFLGQEEDNVKDVKEAPLTMTIPMVVLALFLIVVGTFPGVIFEPLANGMAYLGYSDVSWNMSMLQNVWGNEIHLESISITIATVFVLSVIFITLKGYKGTRQVSTKDISTSGEIPWDHENMNYQQDFFKPFERAFAGMYKGDMGKFWTELGGGVDSISNFLRKIYTGNGQTYAIYVVSFLALLLLILNK
jgi:NADH-quinone oxidoreductase subunit M